MPDTPKPPQSNAKRVQLWHVDPNDPTGPLLDHLPKAPRPSKRPSPEPKSPRNKKKR